ncbi:MAG: helix-turn-helix domain-containing protein [Clostridia bacterium]|nr:helix-turn-helix domain-containing protein [Clostridia bacterium]MBR0409121.1 helix-turn-helix domain-containing protein [Clostridia bacterium]
MNGEELLDGFRTLNESERFYRNYRLAKSSPTGFAEYLQGVDREQVQRLQLLVPEWPETIKSEYLESDYFSPDRQEGIYVSKHNCYTPAIPHHHNFFELFYVLEGRCVHQVRDHISTMHAGDLCFIQPKVTHALDVSDNSVIIDVLIRRSTFRHYFYSILQGDNLLANFFMSTLYSKQGIDYLIFHAEGDDALHRAFIELCGEFMEQEAYYSVLVNAIVTRIFVQLLRRHMDACELPRQHMRDSQTAVRIARYLQTNASSATLGGLAAEFHYSPEYASQLIKQVTGQTFIQLLTAVRLENAEQLLRDTALPVADIASTVGYESSEHFIRTFRKHVGLTPSGYRQKKRAQYGV